MRIIFLNYTSYSIFYSSIFVSKIHTYYITVKLPTLSLLIIYISKYELDDNIH